MRTPGGPIGKGRVDDEAGCAGRVKGPGGCEDRCSVCWEAVACEDACRGVQAQEGPRLCQEARDRTGCQEARGRKSLGSEEAFRSVLEAVAEADCRGAEERTVPCRQGGIGLRRALLSTSTSSDLCSRLRFRLE